MQGIRGGGKWVEGAGGKDVGRASRAAYAHVSRMSRSFKNQASLVLPVIQAPHSIYVLEQNLCLEPDYIMFRA